MINPCKQCRSRFYKCHSVCEDYKEWKDWHLHIMELKRKDRDVIVTGRLRYINRKSDD